MRVKLKDPEKDVVKFEFGKEYGVFFYAMTGYLTFTHTRKRNIIIWHMGHGEKVYSKFKISKRKLKQLFRERDMVQWVIALEETDEGNGKDE